MPSTLSTPANKSIPFKSIAIAIVTKQRLPRQGKAYTQMVGYVELYHVYQVGQELMGAVKGMVLLLEVLLHLKSGNRLTQSLTITASVMHHLTFHTKNTCQVMYLA